MSGTSATQQSQQAAGELMLMGLAVVAALFVVVAILAGLFWLILTISGTASALYTIGNALVREEPSLNEACSDVLESISNWSLKTGTGYMILLLFSLLLTDFARTFSEVAGDAEMTAALNSAMSLETLLTGVGVVLSLVAFGVLTSWGSERLARNGGEAT